MTRQGWSAILFQASQQWSTMALYKANTRFESHLLRMNCQTFSARFSPGQFAGRGTMVTLEGTTRRSAMCQPA